MKNLTILLVVLLIISSNVIAQTETNNEEAINGAALNYIEGWFEGDADRMDKALHSDLTKRGIQLLPTGRTLLSYASKSNMVEYTKGQFGKLPEDQRHIEVNILDIDGNMAMVKIVSSKFIDYVHVGKINGDWKIVNVLWESVMVDKEK